MVPQHHNHPKEPQKIGDILPEVVDVDAQQIHLDPAAEKARKRLVAERLTEVLQQTRSELIEQRQAGESVDPDEIAAIGVELQETVAQREELRRQDP